MCVSYEMGHYFMIIFQFFVVIMIFPSPDCVHLVSHHVHVFVESGNIILEENSHDEENASFEQVADEHRLFPDFVLKNMYSHVAHVSLLVESVRSFLVFVESKRGSSHYLED